METFCEQCQSVHVVANPDSTTLFGEPQTDREPALVVAGRAPTSFGWMLPIDIDRRRREEWMGEDPPA